MLHETNAQGAGGADAANDEIMSRNRRPILADAVITPPRLAGCDAGVIWIDARHDPHWIATDDPDFEHLMAVFVHADHLEDLELRAMIEELVAPRMRAMLAERMVRDGHPVSQATTHSPRSAREHAAATREHAGAEAGIPE